MLTLKPYHFLIKPDCDKHKGLETLSFQKPLQKISIFL